MKILHVCGGMKIGGAERAIYQLVKCQRESGHQADILSTASESFYANKISKLDATVHCLQQKGGVDFRCIGKYLRLARKYDLIHFHTTNPALMLASFMLGKRQRLFYTHRGGYFKYQLRRHLSYRISGFCVKYRFDGISGNTQYAARVASTLFRIPERQIKVTYNGIYFDLLLPHKSSSQVFDELGVREGKYFFIGTAAKLIRLKRINLLIRAISILDDLPIRCLIIGDGPGKSALEFLAKELGVAKKIIFLGQKEHVGDYLNILDIFVLPSNQCESFGNAVVEAMSFTIPSIIMKDGGGMLEHIPDGVDLVAEDAVDLARIIRRIVKSPEIAKEFGIKCNAYVRKKYTVESMKEGYDLLYGII